MTSAPVEAKFLKPKTAFGHNFGLEHARVYLLSPLLNTNPSISFRKQNMRHWSRRLKWNRYKSLKIIKVLVCANHTTQWSMATMYNCTFQLDQLFKSSKAQALSQLDGGEKKHSVGVKIWSELNYFIWNRNAHFLCSLPVWPHEWWSSDNNIVTIVWG